MAKKNINMNKVAFSEKLDSFIIKKCDDSIAGFGTNVWKVMCAGTLKLACYVNENQQIYLPTPIKFQELQLLIAFIKEYNLGNVCSEAV